MGVSTVDQGSGLLPFFLSFLPPDPWGKNPPQEKTKMEIDRCLHCDVRIVRPDHGHWRHADGCYTCRDGERVEFATPKAGEDRWTVGSNKHGRKQ